MRRFILYRRGRIWYAQFYNSTVKRYTGLHRAGAIVSTSTPRSGAASQFQADQTMN